MCALRTPLLSDKAHRTCAHQTDTRACLLTLDYMCKTICNDDDALYADRCWDMCAHPAEGESGWTCTRTDVPNERIRCTSPRVVKSTPHVSTLSYGHISGDQTEYMYGSVRDTPMVWVT